LQAASRYLTHLIVLVSAILVPSFTFSGIRAHQAGPVITAYGADKAVSPTRGFLVKPAVAAGAPVKRAIQTHTVVDGDTVWNIAAQFGVSVDTLRWANGLSDVDKLSLNQKLLIPPVNGVLVTVKPGDTLNKLADKFSVTTQAIVEFNLIRDPNNVAPGTKLMIPDGVGETAPLSAPATSAAPARSGRSSSLMSGSRGIGPYASHFPWGQCTYYVSTRRYVPWNGDAHAWYYNAQAYGYSVGHYPAPGAIMVTWESWWGHVAYVESVDGACWTVSEMNFRGVGVVDYRRICPGQVPLIGFIY
jgi:surface antigen